MDKSIRKYIVENQFLLVLILIILGWVLYKLRDVIIIFFIAYIFAISFLPSVTFLMKKKWPKILAIITPYLLFIIILVAIIIPLIPILSEQVKSLAVSFPHYLEKIFGWLSINFNISQIGSFVSPQFGALGKDLFTFTVGAFEVLFFLFTSIVISIYMLVDYDFFKESIVSLFSEKNHEKVATVFTDVELKLGAWLRGQIVLSLIIGVLCFIGYSLIGLPFALPLALAAGVCEIFPTVGPVLGAIPALIVAITISPTMFILALLVYIFIHAVESNLFVPKIMQKAIGIHPLVVILAIIVGGKLLGIIGAFLSVPVVSLLTTIVEDVREKRGVLKPDTLG